VSRLRWLLRSLSWSRRKSQAVLGSRWLSQPVSRSRWLSLSRSRMRWLSEAVSRSRWHSRWVLRPMALSQTQLNALAISLTLADSTRPVLHRLLEMLPRFAPEKWPQAPFSALMSFSLHEAALDWFAEQADNPELTTLRGLRHGEPLPRQLGLLDERGLPHPVQQRQSFEKLRGWLQDDEAILSFVFPEGLSREDRKLLLDDLAILHQQPWAPEKAVEALLADWPREEKERELTPEVAERRLVEACEEALKQLSPKTRSKK